MYLLINKPKGITSHDVIDRLRKLTGIRKIGHAGTLDPNATGLLIVGIGRESTKRLNHFLGMDKTYIAEIVLGEERDTDDIEGVILRQAQADKFGSQIVPTLPDIKDAINNLVGKQEQLPPAYSAIKLGGKKAYELARRGEFPDLKSREINVYHAKLLEYRYPLVRVEFEVSSGTYIRSLARDMGRALGTYGYLGNLSRTKIGKYSLAHAANLDKLTEDSWREFVVEL